MSPILHKKQCVGIVWFLLVCLLLLPACSDDGSSTDGDLPPADQDTELVDRENSSDGDLDADLPDSDPPPADLDETPVDGDRDADPDSDGDTDTDGDSDADGDHDLDNETPETDGDTLELDADPDNVDNIELEPDVETESDSASEMDQEPDIEALNLSMDTFPFEDTTVVRCEGGGAFNALDVWSNDAGKTWFAGNRFWEYDEASNELRCDERVNEEVFSLDGRLLEGQVEIWIATATRLGRLVQGEWSFFDLPADLVQNETAIDSEGVEEVKHPYSLKVQGAVVALNVAYASNTGVYETGREYDSTHFFFTTTQAWNRVPPCEDMLAQFNEVGYWFGETYYLMGGNRLYALTPEATDCTSIRDFGTDFGEDLSRLIGVDENGLWISRHFPDDSGLDYRALKDQIHYNPISGETTSYHDLLPVPESENDDRLVTTFGMGGWPLMTIDIVIESLWWPEMCLLHMRFYFLESLSSANMETESFIFNSWVGLGCDEGWEYKVSVNYITKARVWRGDRSVWLAFDRKTICIRFP